jgi:predicted nucleic acid-binding protein
VRVVVADASSLILLAKCSLLSTYGRRVTLLAPHRVLAEAAARHLWQAHPDAAEIARCAEEGLVRAEAVRSRRRLPLALGEGEAAAIRLFLARKADLLLSDDGRALRACRLLGVPFTTTPRVIVDLRAAGAIPAPRARRALEKLAVAGRYSRDVIAAALAALLENQHDETDDDPTTR